MDGSLLRTLRMLMHPGALTAEWFAGRRARYVRPLRLFVATLAFYALVSGLLRDSDGPLPWAVDLAGRGRYVLWVPLIAVTVRVALLRVRPRATMVPALVFALHVTTLFVIVETILPPARARAWNSGFHALSNGLFWLQFLLTQVVYYFLAVHRAYALTVRQTLTYGLLAWVMFSAAVPYVNSYFSEGVIALYRTWAAAP